MRRKRKYVGGIATALLIASGVARAAADADADYNILYHETIDNMQIAESRTTRDGIPTKIMSMFVFGEEMVLELENHDRLISSITAGDAEDGASLFTDNQDFEILRGRVTGVDGSWVRLTRSGSTFSGVIYNGEQLLAIEPFSEVKEMITPTDANETSHVIYDTDDMIPMKGQACAVGGVAKEPTYDQLVDELRLAPALGASSQLNVSFVVDSQFVDANRGNVNAAVVDRLNVVDGIFSEQVGVEGQSVRRPRGISS